MDYLETTIEVIKKRERQATPGPWIETEDESGYSLIVQSGTMESICSIGDMEDTEPEDHYNAAFIAHARQDIPALLAEINRLQAELDKANRFIDELTDGQGWGQESEVDVMP